MPVEDEWVFISPKSRVLHQLKEDSKSKSKKQAETLCGRIINLSELRDPTEFAGKCMQCWMRAEAKRPQLPIATQEDILRLEKSRLQKIEGYVYCLSHGSVHDDTLDPYDEGPNQCLKEGGGDGVGVKKEDVHRSVHVRWKVGDYPDA